MKKLLFILLLVGPVSAFAQRGSPLPFARWISEPPSIDSAGGPCPIFKKEFRISKPVRSAWLSITAHGIYEGCFNGQRIGQAYFAPGWTSYDKRLEYQQYDVGRLLKKENRLELTLGDGWWRGVFGHHMSRNNYGSDGSVLAELEIIFIDGTRMIVSTDSSWRYAAGPIRCADFYSGETQDLRIAPDPWSAVAVRDWRKDSGLLVASTMEPVTQGERLAPVRVFRNDLGEQIVDFGQNFAGFVEIWLQGRRGDTIRISHAEALDKFGHFYTGNLREARATDIYVLNGAGTETLAPHFTYHGFRYAKVEGFVATRFNCVGIAVHSRLRHDGTLVCSDALINQLQHNIEWSLNSNFVAVPTDCPQRSERLGWTGDAEIFCRTAAFNRDVQSFFADWLASLRADQGVNGGVPSIIPDLYHHRDTLKGGVAGWGDAATIVPWTLYEVYGDTALLRSQYVSMRSWVDYVAGAANDLLWKARGYGDWYAPGDTTSLAYIDECFFAYSTSLLVRAAEVLGLSDDVSVYGRLLGQIKSAFLTHYIDQDGRAISHTQTAYVLALEFDILPEELRQKAVDQLVCLIRANNDHLATGFLGTPYLLPVLSRFGHAKLADTLLWQQDIPSWLYPVKKGATTIWEKWDAVLGDGSFDTCSLNHYAYGAVGNWLYTVVAGIGALSPGYKKISIHPFIGSRLGWVKATYICRYGVIGSAWKKENGRICYDLRIPPGTSAVVTLPGLPEKELGPGVYHFVVNHP